MSEIEKQEQSEIEGQEQSEASSGVPAAKWLTIVAVVLVVGLGAFILAQRVIVPKLTGDNAVGDKMREMKQNLIEEEVEEVEPVEKDAPTTATALKGITVNTAASRGRRFVTFDLSLESRVSDAEERLMLKEFQIRDALINYFGGRTVTELSSRSFMAVAKDTVATIINDILKADVVDTVYFAKFLVQ